MAIFRRNWREIGGHKWDWEWYCIRCGVGAVMSGSHGDCPQEPKRLRAIRQLASAMQLMARATTTTRREAVEP